MIDRGWKRGVLYLAPGPRLAAIGHALSYPLGEILFSHRITASGGLVLHACAVVVDGCAVLFSGFSGAGKTTMARLWRRHCPSVKILSDDRVVLREHRGGLHAWGTPWHGTGGFASPCGARLRAVVFIRHGTRNDFTPLAPPAAAAMLLARILPADLVAAGDDDGPAHRGADRQGGAGIRFRVPRRQGRRIGSRRGARFRDGGPASPALASLFSRPALRPILPRALFPVLPGRAEDRPACSGVRKLPRELPAGSVRRQRGIPALSDSFATTPSLTACRRRPYHPNP